MTTDTLPLTASSKTTAPTITLRQRIAAALTSPTSSGEVSSCLADAQHDIARIELRIEAVRQEAVNPMASEDEATQAKRDFDSLQFDHQRLTESEKRLNDRLKVVQVEEEDRRRRVGYDAAVTARDAMVAEVKERYPKMASDLLDMLERMGIVERQISLANGNLPSTAPRIGFVEYALREPNASSETVTFLSAFTLPKLYRNGNFSYLRLSQPSWSMEV